VVLGLLWLIFLLDLDSLTSSILYAYFRSISPPQNAFTSLYIPLLNVPAVDIGLRPEFIALFRYANISASHIITRDELPTLSQIKRSLPLENTRWILVDHNKLPGELGSIYASRVHGVIDHHIEENAVPQDTGPEPRMLEKSGSCTSLIVNYFRSTWDAVSESSLSSGAGHAQSSDSIIDDAAVTRGWDAQIAKLALASILEDTVNLTSSSKTVSVDREMVAYLEAKIQLSPKDARTWNRDQFYEEITTAKKDIDTLSCRDILRKDYKLWTESGRKLGMSTVVKPLCWLATKAAQEDPHNENERAFNDSLEVFMTERDLSMFAIMTASTSIDGKFQRQLLVQADSRATNAANEFVSIATDKLGLENIEVEGITQEMRQTEPSQGIWRRIWLQKETGMSRKQVGPLIRKAMM